MNRDPHRFGESSQHADLRIAALEELVNRLPGSCGRVAHPLPDLLVRQPRPFQPRPDGFHYRVFVALFPHPRILGNSSEIRQ